MMMKMKPSFHVIMMMVTLMMIMRMNDVMGFKEFKVGGRFHGWTLPKNNDTDFFDHWASKKRFHVGDTLVFEYKNDSVLVVNKYDYYHCNSSNATNTFSDGNTVIRLEHPGFIYFISGNLDRCLGGLRMVVDVMSHPRVAHAPTSLANPPETINQADAPGPSSVTNSGSHPGIGIAQVSSLLGLFVAIISMFF